jgi:prepilin-type N-terminal cleavage/methylation domain-containing protein
MHQTNKISLSRGFTLIELMLAMAFFSSILIVTTSVLVQVLGIYNKGLAVKQMNGVGRMLADDVVRVGNSARGEVDVQGKDSDGTHPRCMQIGNNVYVWSYQNDVALNKSHYRTSSGPISFAQLKNPDGGCPPTATVLLVTAIEPMLSASVRVYAGEVKPIGGATNLLSLRLVLGTYSSALSTNNPTLNADGKSVQCAASSLGNFCAFGTYETVIYLPNGG